MTPPPARERPKLLFTVNDAGFFVSHRLPVALAARRAGYDVHVATAPGPGVAEIVANGFPHYPVPISRSGLNPLSEIRTVWALTRLYRRLRPDLVHLVTIKPVLYGGIAARLSRVPAVVAAVSGLGHVFIRRGSISALLRAPIKATYRLAMNHRRIRVIFQNPDDREEFVSGRVVGPNRTVLIKGSGVDIKMFAPTPEPDGPPIIILPARMLWPKGIGEFVDAATRLRKQRVAARFALVGESDKGNPTAIPLKQLEAWHNEGEIEWWGYRKDMPAVLAGTHIVCLPSYYREGVPKSLIEAAACARPIVATDVPGCREIARNGENAILVPPRDPEALAAALCRLIDDPDLRRRLGARGREIAVAEFLLDRVIADTLDVYRNLMAEIGRPVPRPEESEPVPCSHG